VGHQGPPPGRRLADLGRLEDRLGDRRRAGEVAVAGRVEGLFDVHRPALGRALGQEPGRPIQPGPAQPVVVLGGADEGDQAAGVTGQVGVRGAFHHGLDGDQSRAGQAGVGLAGEEVGDAVVVAGPVEQSERLGQLVAIGIDMGDRPGHGWS
jgi:hypothetical protein